MLLREFVYRYIESRGAAKEYGDQLFWFINAYERSLDRQATIADLNVDAVNAHIRKNRDVLADKTRNTHRRLVLALWQGAADSGLAPDPPRHKITRVRVRHRSGPAWSFEEVTRLLAAAEQLDGTYSNGVSKRHYWYSYVLGARDSGLRGCELRDIRIQSLLPDGWCMHLQQRTGRLIQLRFRPETMDAIAASYPPDRPRIWECWCKSIEPWRREARQLVAMAGLKGSIGRLQRCDATAFEVQTAEQACDQCDLDCDISRHNVTPGLTIKREPSEKGV